MARQTQTGGGGDAARKKRLWLMVGAGVAAVAVAVAVIVFAALNTARGGSGENEIWEAGLIENMPDYAHIRGNLDAPVVVVEYSDFM